MENQTHEYGLAQEQPSTYFSLVKLAKELHRPLLHPAEIIAALVLTVAPILLAWLSGHVLFLGGLVLPFLLIHAAQFSALRRQADALRRSLIWQVPAAKRKEFLDAVARGGPAPAASSRRR